MTKGYNLYWLALYYQRTTMCWCQWSKNSL